MVLRMAMPTRMLSILLLALQAYVQIIAVLAGVRRLILDGLLTIEASLAL